MNKSYSNNLTTYRIAYLPGFALEFRTYLNIKRDDSSIVPLGVWEISSEDEKHLDRYEGYPHFYLKELIKFEFKGKIEKGLVYVMREGVREIEPPF